MSSIETLATYRPNFLDCDKNKESYANYVNTLASLIEQEGGKKLADDFWNAGIEIGGFWSASTLASWQESWGKDFCYDELTGMFARMDNWFGLNGAKIPKTNDAFLRTMINNWGFNTQNQEAPKQTNTPHGDTTITPFKEDKLHIPPAILIIGGLVAVSFIWALLGPTIKALRE